MLLSVCRAVSGNDRGQRVGRLHLHAGRRLPAMRRPTVSPLFENGSYDVKARSSRRVTANNPGREAAGGTAVVVSTLPRSSMNVDD